MKPPLALIKIWLLSLICLTAWQEESLGAVPLRSTIEQIERQWDEIYYHGLKDQRKEGLTQLLTHIRALKKKHPEQAGLLIWEAIVLVTRTGVAPDLSALSNLDEARHLLLQAIEIEPKALDGAAYLALGCLYYQAPGWPLSFGDKQKAERYLRQALALNPDGIEANYYFADYLRQTGRLQEALGFFQKAATLPDNPNQPWLSTQLKKEAATALQALVARLQQKPPAQPLP